METGPNALGAAISELGYQAKTPSRGWRERAATKQVSRLYVPSDAPKFFVDAIERARATQRPIIVDFWAEWCPACLQLKRETLEHPDVSKALSAVEVIYVDLDEFPALGEAHGVVAIPDVFFADSTGRIVDRLRNFEPPEAFVARVRRAFGRPLHRDTGNDEASGDNAEGGGMDDVTVLAGSLNPLRDHFNANKSKHRVIAILSPT